MNQTTVGQANPFSFAFHSFRKEWLQELKNEDDNKVRMLLLLLAHQPRNV